MWRAGLEDECWLSLASADPGVRGLVRCPPPRRVRPRDRLAMARAPRDPGACCVCRGALSARAGERVVCRGVAWHRNGRCNRCLCGARLTFSRFGRLGSGGGEGPDAVGGREGDGTAAKPLSRPTDEQMQLILAGAADGMSQISSHELHAL